MHVNSLSSENTSSIMKLRDKPGNKTQQLPHPEGKVAPCSLLRVTPTSELHGPSEGEVPKARPSVLLSCQQLFLYAGESSLHAPLLFTTTAGY